MPATAQSITPYDGAFFSDVEDGSLSGAMVVMKLLLDLMPIGSVVDLGCGIGTWLHAAQALGIADIDGYDGDYVDRNRLHIDANRFHAADLAEGFLLTRHYDVALSLEVAEHLPASRADAFVGQLTDAAPIVVFSAAIPGQGGTHHINEQWQDVWRANFAARDFHPIDYLRPRIRGNPAVPWWYQQNILLYCHASVMLPPALDCFVPPEVSLNLVHPELYNRTVQDSQLYLTKAVRSLPALAYKAFAARVRDPRVPI